MANALQTEVILMSRVTWRLVYGKNFSYQGNCGVLWPVGRRNMKIQYHASDRQRSNFHRKG